jgi:hypothetical protein
MQLKLADMIIFTVLENYYSLRRKIFAPFDFYRSCLTIRLIQNFCENVKTIMIYLKYI